MNSPIITDKHILSWIEHFYHENNEFPSTKAILKAWPKTFPTLHQLHVFLDSPHIQTALYNRGLTSSPTNPNSALTEKQLAAILSLSNTADKRSRQTKLKELGVTTTQWNAWVKQKRFKEFFNKQLSADFENSVDRAFTGLLSSVDRGDTKAVQLYLEMTGRQPTENERNYKLAISRLIESITRHVKDPEIIKQIAKDFELIEQGLEPTRRLLA